MSVSRRRVLVGLVVSCLVTSLSSRVAADPPAMREALVAIVGGTTPREGTDLVWLSDLRLRARLAHEAGAETLSVSAPELAQAFEITLGELLIAREASRLRSAEPSSESVARAEEALIGAVGGPERLEALLLIEGAGRDEVRRIAERRAIVEAFLASHLESSAEVTEAEVDARLASGQHPFVDLDATTAREPLRAWLRSERVRADVARWLSVLRQRTPVRILRELG